MKPKKRPKPAGPQRKHKRIASFIAAYEALCKSDIQPKSRFTALKGMMEELKSSYEDELTTMAMAHIHIGEEKNKGFKKNHDPNGGGGGAGAARSVGFFNNY